MFIFRFFLYFSYLGVRCLVRLIYHRPCFLMVFVVVLEMQPVMVLVLTAASVCVNFSVDITEIGAEDFAVIALVDYSIIDVDIGQLLFTFVATHSNVNYRF